MRRRLVPLCIILIHFIPLHAQEDSAALPGSSLSPLTWAAMIRGSVHAGGEAYDIASIFGEASVSGKYLRGSAVAGFDIRLRQGNFFGDAGLQLDVKEAYAGIQSKSFDLLLGQQIVVWGRTDGFNPTNNVCSYDYFFLSTDADDQRLGNLMLRTRLRLLPRTELEVLGLPFYLPSVYRYDLFDMGGQARFIAAELPSRELKNAGLAARLNVELNSLGFSLSYFNGLDPFYGFRVASIQLFPSVMVTNQASFYRKQSLGSDIAVPLGSWIVRAEGAWDMTTGYGDTMQIPNPSLNYVLGVERDIGGVTCILQYVGKHTLHFKDITEPVLLDSNDLLAQLQYGLAMIDYESTRFNRIIHHQQEAYNHAVFLAMRRSFAYEVLEAELSGYYNISSEECFIRPQLRWHLNDALTCSLGAYYMLGKEDEVFDRAGKVLNGVCLGLTTRF